MRSNDLAALPPGVFSGLSSIAKLYLGSNDLATLRADVFSGLSSLELIELGDNELTALPAGVFSRLFSGLSSLESLSLSLNGIPALPEDVFSGLSNRWRVSICITTASTSFPRACSPGCRRWTALWLFNNSLNKLPPGVFCRPVVADCGSD